MEDFLRRPVAASSGRRILLGGCGMMFCLLVFVSREAHPQNFNAARDAVVRAAFYLGVRAKRKARRKLSTTGLEHSLSSRRRPSWNEQGGRRYCNAEGCGRFRSAQKRGPLQLGPL